MLGRLNSINVSEHTEDMNKLNNIPRLYRNEGGEGQQLLIAIGKCGELGIYHFVAATMGLIFSEIYKYVLSKSKRIPKGNQQW
jgi:hypothetical protein